VTGISNIKALRRGGLAIASILLVAAFALPGSAMAGECSQANSDPTAAQYCSPAGVHENGNNEGGPEQGVKGANEEGSNGPTSNGPTTEAAEPSVAVEEAPSVEAAAVQESSSSSSLPFTGLDVGILAIVAVALGATGLVLRRLTAPRSTH
jgi:cobalamin biosynthesis Mg chelatase CobN